MIKQTGTVSSYKELGEKFLNFVQRGNDTTQPWEVIDDRLDSFYGATIKFPVNNISKTVSISERFDKLKEKESISVTTISFDIGEDVSTYSRDCYYEQEDNIIMLTQGSRGSSMLDNSRLSRFTNDYESQLLYYNPLHKLFDLPPIDKSTLNNIFVQTVYGLSGDYDKSVPVYSDDNYNTYFSFDKCFLSPDSNISAEDFSTTLNCDILILNFSLILTEAFLIGREDILEYVISYCLDVQNMVSELDNPPLLMCQIEHIADMFTYDLTSDTDIFSLRPFSKLVYNEVKKILSNKLTGWTVIFKPLAETCSRTDVIFGSNQTCFSDKICTYIFSNAWGGKNSLEVPIYIGNLATYSSDIPWEQDAIQVVESMLPSVEVTVENYFPKVIGKLSYPRTKINRVQDFFSANAPSSSTDGYDIAINKEENNSYAYISLQYNKITSTTYNEWLTNTKDNYMSESFDSRRRIPAYYNNTETWRTVTISNQYQHDIANIFKDTGEVLFISPHIKYDKNLWMCEQGGIACDQETRTQTIEDNCIRHRKLTQNFGGYESQAFVKVPPFPSLGCPMFTINAEQLDQGQINYYFIRDNASASIVVYVPSLNSLKYDYYVQHISFGVLDCFSISEQFMYPLYVGGGSGGLYHDHWSYYSPGSGVPSHEIGNIYKLDMENISMSNSNILLSAKFNGANVSNFRVLCPDGHWDNIFNVSQNASLIVDPYECWPSSWTARYYVLQQPIVGGSELGDARYGGTTTLNGVNSIKRIDTCYIEPEYRTTELDKYSKTSYVSTPIQPVIPVFSSHKIVSLEGWPRHRYGVLGKIPRCYSTWSRNLRFGELEINGKKFLAIPNAYDHRKWYPAYDVHVDFANLESYLKSKENASSEIYNDFIYDYLLLSLED